jgi:uncharacterized protein (TIGR04255 family)
LTKEDIEIPQPHPLPNKPLVEVVFELRWQLEEGRQPGLMADPGFRIFMGRFYDRVKGQYPHIEDVPASQVPDDMTPHTVRHQFWTGKRKWPVVQIGPGIVTVNETEGYLWDSFRPRLVDAINALYASYPAEIFKLKPAQVTLKYIDAVEFDPAHSKTPLLRFLRESLHTGIDVEPLLFQYPKEAASPLGVNLTLNFRSEKPKGAVILTIANGFKETTSSIIWETTIVSKQEDVPTTFEQFAAWLDDAHKISDTWFFTLTRGQLLRGFEAKTDASENVGLLA